MTNSIVRWGLICGAVMTVFMYVPQIFIFGDKIENFAAAEVAGYIGMVAALLVIVLAINSHFKGAGPTVSIWQRLMLGLGITLIAGIIFGLSNNIYTMWINPDFIDSYYDYYVSNLSVQEGPEYDKAVAEALAQREMFGSPFMIFLVMAATVWMIGIVVSILASVGHWYLTRRNSTLSA
ncbi:DUF4199 domain-containing protein [Maritalea sp.]|uniref:DUF4199 domain-containing protein n=1 Tax=Maritalea sp. TaxID=2003361 RepID=UPI003EF7AE46